MKVHSEEAPLTLLGAKKNKSSAKHSVLFLASFETQGK